MTIDDEDQTTQPEATEEPEVASEETRPEANTEDKGGEEEPLRDDKGRFKGVQARIDELTRARREAERERDYFKGLVSSPTPQSPQAGAQEKPTPEQFDDYADYVEALTDWKVTEQLSKTAKVHQDQVRHDSWASRVKDTRATLTDYDEVVGSSDIQLAGHVHDALLDSEHGPELAYHMARNPDVAERLNRMSPLKAAMELGRLETSLTGQPAKAATKAPAPITPVNSGPSSRVDMSKTDMDTYIAERRKQGARY